MNNTTTPSKSFTAFAVGALALLGFQIALPESAQAILPAYVTDPNLVLQDSYNVANPSSFGFFFETTSDVVIDALGFSSYPGWPTGSSSYTVTLWEFNGDPLNPTPSNFQEKSTAKFTPGTFYTFLDGYFWDPIQPIALTESLSDDNKVYVIAAIGDFSFAPGNVAYEGQDPPPVINSRFVWAGNGFNDITDEGPDAFYPVPIGDGNIGINGYFNPNLSYVPGPLPVLGAASAFSWSRRLRKRLRSTR